MSDQADILRRPVPQNLEAEQAAIGAVLIDNQLFEPIAEVLSADDFYLEKHRVMWAGIEALFSARRPADAVTLADALRPRLDEIGGAGYIAECAALAPVAMHAFEYARIVKEKSTQRKLVALGNEITQRAYDSPVQWAPDYTEEAIAATEYELAKISSDVIRKPEPRKAETLATVLWRIAHGKDSSIPTGFPAIDGPFGGFNVGHLTMLAARTSVGKTALATAIAINAARAGFKTAFFSLEMTADEMWTRAISYESQVDMFRARRSGYRNDERERVEKARKTLASRRSKFVTDRQCGRATFGSNAADWRATWAGYISRSSTTSV